MKEMSAARVCASQVCGRCFFFLRSAFFFLRSFISGGVALFQVLTHSAAAAAAIAVAAAAAAAVGADDAQALDTNFCMHT